MWQLVIHHSTTPPAAQAATQTEILLEGSCQTEKSVVITTLGQGSHRSITTLLIREVPGAWCGLVNQFRNVFIRLQYSSIDCRPNQADDLTSLCESSALTKLFMIAISYKEDVNGLNTTYFQKKYLVKIPRNNYYFPSVIDKDWKMPATDILT